MRCNHLSNSFEGYTLTYSETQLLLVYGRSAGEHELQEYEEMKAHGFRARPGMTTVPGMTALAQS